MNNAIKIRGLYILFLVVSLFFLIYPFIIPIIFAATISLTLMPLLKYLMRKGMKENHACALLTTLFAILISIPLFFFVIKGTIEVTRKLERFFLIEKRGDQGVQDIFRGMRQDLFEAIEKYSLKYHLDFLDQKKMEEYLSVVYAFVLNFFRNFLTGLPVIFILFLIMILCTYSFLKHSQSIRRFFQAITGLSDELMNQLIHIFIMDSRQVYLSNIVTGGIQSLIVAAGVSILGSGDFFLVFFITLILSFIPVVGAAPVAFLFALIVFFQGDPRAAIALVILGIVTGVIDNILRPWLATFGESKIPPVVAFICVIGGALWLGFPGLFIGLLLGSIAYDTLPIFWKEFERKK